jgi:hypothetical protein
MGVSASMSGGALMRAHLTQMVGTAQHIVSGSPSDIAVEWNPQRVIDLALNL